MLSWHTNSVTAHVNIINSVSSEMSFSSLWLIPRNNRRLLVTSCNKLRSKGTLISCSDWSIAKIMPSDWLNCHWVSRDCMTWQWMDFKSSVWGLTATQCIPIVQCADNIDKRPVTGPCEGECGQCSQSSERRSFTRHKCCCLLSLNNLLSSLCLLDTCQEWAASSSETGGMYKYFM